MTTYAVTGATGQLGRLVVPELLARGVPAADVIGIARSPEKAADLGVAVRRADYADPATLRAAFEGVDVLLLVSGNELGKRLPQHTAVIEAAKAVGVGRIAYTSITAADRSASPLAPEHKATEEALRASGVPSTILRNNWYTENYTAQLPQYLAAGAVLGIDGDARVGAATRADMAAAAVSALLDDTTGDTVLEISGPPITLSGLASTITDVTGTKVAFRQVTPEEYTAVLRAAGLDDGTAAFVVGLDESVARGDLDLRSDDLERLIGRPATTLEQAVRDAPQG